MKITLATKFYQQSVTVEHASDDLTIDEVIEILVRPALLAMGYGAEGIEEVIGEINYEACSLPVDDER